MRKCVYWGCSKVKDHTHGWVDYMTTEDEPSKDHDPVASPSHYMSGGTYETVRVIEAWELGYHLGNAVKYISRAGKKGGPGKREEDLRKAIWYLERAIDVTTDDVKCEGEGASTGTRKT